MAVSSTEADLVLAGGKIRTPAHPSGFVQALAVRDGVILAVGNDDEMRELAGAPASSTCAGGWRCRPSATRTCTR